MRKTALSPLVSLEVHPSLEDFPAILRYDHYVVLALPPHMGQACQSCIGSSFLPNGAFPEEGAYAISRRLHAGSLEALRVARPEAVGLARTNVTDAGLVHLKGLVRLSDLSLGDTPVTDAGLVHLKGLHNLWRLDLGGSDVTDAGLVNLKACTTSRGWTSVTLTSPALDW